MSQRTASQQLASFASQLKVTTVPDEVRHHVRLLILDALGVGLAAADESYTDMALEVVRQIGGRKEATILGRPEKLPAAWAALVNGIQIHGHDFDDTHSGSIAHTTSVIVPTALGLAERQSLRGEDLLKAVIAGLEVTCRTGLASRGGFHTRGYHTTAIAGAMGGSLAASACLGLDAERMVFAQGIAGSSASGLREAYLSGGTWTKLYHPGWAAHAAVMAGLMAQSGFSGTSTVYEGRFGLFKSHLHPEDGDYEALLQGLGERWEIMNIAFKPYPCGVINHSFIDLAIRISREHAFRSEEIDSVVAFIHPDAAQTVCEPIETKRRPVSGYHAKFSLPFSIAAALKEGDVHLGTYTDRMVEDASILSLVDKVTYRPDPGSPYPKDYPGKLEIRLKDGRVIQDEVASNKGSRRNPMQPDEVQKKFFENVQGFLKEEEAEQVCRNVLGLEGLEDVRSVAGMLSGS